MFRLLLGRCRLSINKVVIDNVRPFRSSSICSARFDSGTYQRPRPLATHSEREYLKLQHDPDVFGAATQSEFDADGLDEDEEREERFVSERPRGLRTKQYADLIKGHLQAKRIKEALDVLEVKMIKEDRVKPENYIYNLLIGGCARAGYAKKAFQLFNRMKQRQLLVTGGTYTSLFNACAMSPFLGDGLKRAHELRQLMMEKGYEPNLQNYNAMIKAFGRCGDILTAFQLVDEMISKRLPVRVETINFLLQACVTDKQLGFRHALLVWSKMLRWRQRPDIYSFNLLLRIVRDCGMGDLETTEEVVRRICAGSSDTLLLGGGNGTEPGGEQGMLDNHQPEDQRITIVKSDLTEIPDSSMPNLIAQKPHLGQLIELQEVVKPEDRFLLVGGMRGFTTEMDNYGVAPDLKTFTEMLEVIPPTLSAEKHLLSMVRKYNIRVDIDFLNILIKKRSMRFDYGLAKEVLKMIKTARLTPDIVTYGVLALGCQNEAEAQDLMSEMARAEVRVNMPILGAMLKQGCLQMNFSYINSIMDIVIGEELRPNEQFVIHLHKFYKKATSLIRDKDPRIENEREFSKALFGFKVKMEEFNEKFGLVDRNLEESLKRIRVHPYQQFKQGQEEGFERVKNEKRKNFRKVNRKLGDDQEMQVKDLPSGFH